MEPRRVVVTGIGVISSIGHSAGEFWDSLRYGRPGIRPIELVDRTKLRFENAAEVAGYNPQDHFPGKEASMVDRFAQFAAVAAREAIQEAGLAGEKERLRSAAVITGSCIGGQTTEDQGFVDLYLEGRGRVHPLTIPRTMANGGASRISLEYGIQGPVYTVATACSSSNHAIGQAYWMVRQGLVETAVTGGSEATFSMGILKAWEAMRVVSPETCRPFSRDRRGLILGEGGAALVLETLESAQSRGARIHAEIVGFGMSSDAHHLTQPSAEGPALAMRMALDDANLTPEAIGYINAHGTGTLTNDPTETAAIRAVFGSAADSLAISSTKSMHGHTLGAAGAVEAVATILALREGVFPPTANFTEADPACDLDVVPNTARERRVEYALSNSFAFGGLNAVTAFRSPDAV
ncbi:MAG: beta-ketoacyl-[acyl-carrier-protein] synthase family protein [bacterium]|nr:beta-ketoacyl-[acyl-carrier-protein] synthase family protein [bacterium]